jgi:RNA polymerase sigma-70 factor (ECF subfamily)
MARETSIGGPDGRFRETLWTVILRSRDPGTRRESFARLIEVYWKPVYVYLRSRGLTIEDAKDAAQGFFIRFLEKDFLADVAPEKGRFRSFLLAALAHFLSKERRRDRAEKRGGGRVVPMDFAAAEAHLRPARDPEEAFQREWAVALVETATARLREECAADGRGDEFDRLAPYLTRGTRHAGELARSLGRTPKEVARRLFALRSRLRTLIRALVAQSVSSRDEFDEEMKEFSRIS